MFTVTLAGIIILLVLMLCVCFFTSFYDLSKLCKVFPDAALLMLPLAFLLFNSFSVFSDTIGAGDLLTF